MPADLAVVVVNYNAGDHLRRALLSTFGAAGDLELDVVVVDNASTDGSAARAASATPGVRILANTENRGFAAAANQGMAATDAPYVFLLNPDAEIVGGTLSAFVKVADERPGAGAIGPLVRNPDGSIQPSARIVPGTLTALGHAFLGPVAPGNRFTRRYTMADWDRRTEREVDWVSGSAMLVRRAAIDEVGPFDEGYFMYVEDVDLCTRLRKGGWTALFVPELEVVHAAGVSSRPWSREMAFAHSRSIERYFRTHVARGPKVLLVPFVHAALSLRARLVARRARGAHDR